jgi:hypothetical protein
MFVINIAIVVYLNFLDNSTQFQLCIYEYVGGISSYGW